MRIARWIIAIVALAYLIYELTVHHNSGEIIRYTKKVFSQNPWPLIIVLCLTPVNWMLETWKWQYMLRPLCRISYLTTLKGVLMGVFVSLFTPNGIGEFVGRMWVVEADKREASIGSSIAGNMSQLAITITFGGACIVFFSTRFLLPGYQILINVLSVLTVIIGFILYFRMPEIANWLFRRFSWFKKHQQFVDTFNSYGFIALSVAYVLSLVRYLVFCFQMFVLVRFTVTFESGNTPENLFFLMPVYFYIQTLVPTVALGEIGIRGAVLTFLLDGALSPIPIVMTTTLIWLTNIVLPAVVGLILSFFTNIDKNSP